MASTIFRGDDLLKWSPVHSARIRRSGQSIIFNDADQADWHLLRIEDPEYCFRRIGLRIVARPLPGGDANLYVHHYGGFDVVEVDRDGHIVVPGIAQRTEIARRPDGFLEIKLEVENRHFSLNIGASKRNPRYAARSTDQFEIAMIEVSCLDALPIVPAVDASRQLKLVDVGGAGGLQFKWLQQANRISPVLFEPDPREAAKLRRFAERFPGGKVIEAALAEKSGRKTLHVAQYFGCTSLREPNRHFLKTYRIAPAFEIVDRVEVECSRYDELYASGLVPVPDVIKIDVQGYEYEVLQGFGALLGQCLAIELEAHFYPIYQGQKLLGDLIALLAQSGLMLRTVAPVPNFDGDLVEVDALFTRRMARDAVADTAMREKCALIAEVLQVSL